MCVCVPICGYIFKYAIICICTRTQVHTYTHKTYIHTQTKNRPDDSDSVSAASPRRGIPNGQQQRYTGEISSNTEAKGPIGVLKKEGSFNSSRRSSFTGSDSGANGVSFDAKPPIGVLKKEGFGGSFNNSKRSLMIGETASNGDTKVTTPRGVLRKEGSVRRNGSGSMRQLFADDVLVTTA